MMIYKTLSRGHFSKINFSARILCAGLLLFAVEGVALAVPVARLRRIEPVVSTQSGPGKGWIVARERDALEYGDTIRTGPKGKADVLFANGTKIALRARTSIQIMAPARADSPLVIRVFGALSEVFVRPKGNTQIRTAAAIAAARGTEYLVRLPEENSTEVIVTEGSVDFGNEQGRVVVEESQRSTARVGERPSPPVRVDTSGALAWTADVTGLPLEWETPYLSPSPGALSSALRKGQQAVQLNPGSGEAHRQWGTALYDAGAYVEAATQFQKAVEHAPNDFVALLGWSRAERGRGNGTGAVEAASRALKIAPDNDQAALELTLAELVRGDFAAARAALVSIEKTDSGLAALGFIRLREGDASGAESALRAALTLNPRFYQAQSFLALALLTQNKVDDARQAARSAVRLEPQSAQAQGTLAMVLFFAGESREAVEAANRALDINPNSPFAC
jgi:Tfp pilus assembly protein PilF